MRCFFRFLFGIPLMLTFLTGGRAADTDNAVWQNRLGQKPPVIVSTPATGPVAAADPFDPSTYGMVRGSCPATSTDSSCILVYTRTLNKDMTPLLACLEAVAAENKMDDSYATVFDAKGAQRGGYTVDEMIARIKELKEFAAKIKLVHLSTGIAASPRAATLAGLDPTHDVAIVLLRANPDPLKGPVVSWYRVLSTKGLNAEADAEIGASLRTAIKSGKTGQ